MTRRGLLGVLAVAAITACSRGHAAALTPNASRIVSLAPSTTEALFAIGAGDRVVGRSRFCDFPPQATALPIVGGVEPDLEAILDLQPDLVVGVYGLTSARLAEKLAERSIATWFSHADSLAEVEQLLEGLGRRTGHETEATQLCTALAARAQAIERAVAAELRSRALLVVSLSPVVVAGPTTFADELIRRAGGQNVVSERGGWPRLGMEEIVAIDPDVILDATAAPSDGASRIAPSAPGWNSVRAVREGRVIPIRDDRVLRPGPRVVDGLAVLARALHPSVVVP
jgi:iron complex transport system substrate-binding protein